VWYYVGMVTMLYRLGGSIRWLHSITHTHTHTHTHAHAHTRTHTHAHTHAHTHTRTHTQTHTHAHTHTHTHTHAHTHTHTNTQKNTRTHTHTHTHTPANTRNTHAHTYTHLLDALYPKPHDRVESGKTGGIGLQDSLERGHAEQTADVYNVNTSTIAQAQGTGDDVVIDPWSRRQERVDT